MRKVKIGLLGFGNVGRGTYEALNMNRSHIEKKTSVHHAVPAVSRTDGRQNISRSRSRDARLAVRL